MLSSLPFTFSFLFLMMFGTLFSISSMHWLGIWAGLELNLIGFLPLLIYQKTSSESESAVKYFIIQAMGSSLLMFGSLNLYTMSFTWEVINFNQSTFYFTIILMSLLMKVGMFPFYYWLPSVMAGLHWFSCMLLATWQKIAPLFLMVALLESSTITWMSYILCLFAAGASIIGGIGGMNQTQIRALLAYSSIGHLGWITFASTQGSWSMKMYLTIYIIITGSIFMFLWNSNLNMIKVSTMLANSSKNLITTMILFLSLAGLPPMLGFMSKWAVITNATSSVLWLPLFILILGSVLSLFYYLSLSYSLFLSLPKTLSASSQKMNKVMILLLMLNLWGGLILLTENFLFTY
uniref:NADH-ubiquinone oxidoreductase chain 2 n=1 Tax=Bithynia leachii TaxID=2722873 RepID=A0A7D7IVM8_9CAEN|nr:NADH dehydrogenase subunit 2 [Bithynia leachii]